MHLKLLTDKHSQRKFRSAIWKTVSSVRDCVVMDLGCGTAIHSMFACQAGAKKVYAVESSNSIHLAKELVRSNGFQEKIVFIQGNSSEISIPERVDLLVSSQSLATYLKYFPDAVERFLKEDGTHIPEKAYRYFVPIECADFYQKNIRFWERRHYSIDYSRFREFAVNQVHDIQLNPCDYLAKPLVSGPLLIGRQTPRRIGWELAFPVERAGTLHGFGSYYRFQLLKGIIVDTEVPRADSASWNNTFLPIARPIRVRAGDLVNLRLEYYPMSDPPITRWRGEVRTNLKVIGEFGQASFLGNSIDDVLPR